MAQTLYGLVAAHLPTNLAKGYIPLELGSWRVQASNDVPAIAVASGNGGNLAKDSAPIFEHVNGATDQKLRIKWAAGSAVPISINFDYPPDLDDTAAVVVNLLAKMGGATDTPTITVSYFEGVGDTDAGGATAALSTTLAQVTRSIAAGDVGAYPKSASVELTPGAHANDALELYGAWIEYTRKS